jgi:hypothetical protein
MCSLLQTGLPDQDKPNLILRLPLELRQQIYEYALSELTPATYCARYGNYLTLDYFPLDFSRYHLKNKTTPQTFLPSLLYVGPQYRGEALSIFLKTNTIRIEADYAADKFLVWLKEVDLFSSIHSLDLPFFNHAPLGKSVQELLRHCPNLRELTMTFSKERIIETRDITGKSTGRNRRSRARSLDQRLKTHEDVALSMESTYIEEKWREKLGRVRDLPCLTTLTLVVHGMSHGEKWRRSLAKDDLKQLKEWFDEEVKGRIVVRTEIRDGYNSGAPHQV